MKTPRRSAGRPAIRPLALLALAALGLGFGPWVGRAGAQYGAGGFGGYGGFGYNPENAGVTVNYLNQRSLVDAQAAIASRPQPLQAPIPVIRDDSFYQRYDLATREAMIDRVARHPDAERGTADPSGVARPRPRPANNQAQGQGAIPPPPVPTRVYLANYFSKDNRLIWPSTAPLTGDFAKKQAAADQAILAVLSEYNANGLANVSTVNDARAKLVDYGQPALAYVQDHSTPALADSFHAFLLALYSNLSAAATVPKAK